MDTEELIAILEALGTEDVSIEEANRRVGLLETEPGRYNCGTCRYFRFSQCQRPGQPPRPEHPQSVRCGDYVFDDPRDHALPVDYRQGRKSRLFK